MRDTGDSSTGAAGSLQVQRWVMLDDAHFSLIRGWEDDMCKLVHIQSRVLLFDGPKDAVV